MLDISIGWFRKEKWFYDKPRPGDMFGLNIYRQCSLNKDLPGFHRQPFHTKIIALDKADEQTLLNNFPEETRYEIRRAERDGVVCSSENDPDRFISFFNRFAETKKLYPIRKKIYFRDKSCFLITKASAGKEDLVMHSYILDPQGKRARLLQSASLFRKEQDPGRRSLTGRANRLLHYHDMVILKKSGVRLYDVGGYAKETTNRELRQINNFKDELGGVMVEESDYIPLILGLIYKSKNILSGWKRT